ncbi:hypothetical protein RDWZM_004486 [Blomia tropicalis]|uniref:Zinc transporter 1 n=1 Tax=Blomia tropicalis TaxID=40697 RepID=A0A9Q0M4C5_BLOTA|nr:hypothetical protein RDWZM_004486 [Blomia tropicalis]
MTMFSNAKCRLLSMLCLTFLFFMVEIIVGYFTNSTALIADSFHMLSDVVALVIAYVSVRMSPKKWSKNTFGWARAEVLGALINAVFLLALCFSILIESFKRFVDPEKLHNPLLVLVVGVIGLIVNIIGLFLFHDHGHSHASSGSHMHVPQEEVIIIGNSLSHDSKGAIVLNNGMKHANGTSSQNGGDEIANPQNQLPQQQTQKRQSRNMNMHGVFLHVLADALGSVIVIISALVVQYTDWKYNIYVDPGLSVIMVIIIAHSTLPLLIDSALILLQTVPTHIQIDSLQRKLLEEIDGVLAVHEFHVWQLAGDRIIASAHIRCRNLHDYMQIAEKVKEFFHNEGIHSTTIQPEFAEFETELPDGVSRWSNGRSTLDNDCALDCPPGLGSDNCLQNTCCGPQQSRKSPNIGEVEDVEAGTPPNGRKLTNRKSAPGSIENGSDSDLILKDCQPCGKNVVESGPSKMKSAESVPRVTSEMSRVGSPKIPLIVKDNAGKLSSCSSSSTLSECKDVALNHVDPVHVEQA